MDAVGRMILRVDRVTTGLALALACAGMGVAVGAGAWQVLTRFLLNQPSPWSEALVRLALIWMALLGLSAALRQGALVSIDVAHRLSSGPFRAFIEALTVATTIVMMGVLVWFGWSMAERVRFQGLAGLDISIAWGYAAIPVGAAFAIISVVAHWFDRRSTELDVAV